MYADMYTFITTFITFIIVTFIIITVTIVSGGSRLLMSPVKVLLMNVSSSSSHVYF